MNRKKLSPKRKIVRARIIESALDSFSKQGFDSTAISAIARKANIANGTIYLYFDNKEDLFQSVVEEAVSKILERIDSRIQTLENPIEKILKLFDVSFEEFTGNPEISRMIIIDYHHVKGLYQNSAYHPMYLNYLQYIKKICSAAIDMGFIRKVDAEALAQMIFACIEHVLRTWLYSGCVLDLNTVRKRMLNIFVYGFVKY